MDQIKATVSITTYNHEKYIAQAIESVLIQKTDFLFEILIGEDDSSDKTRQIVLSYKNKYPEKIRLSLNDRNNVIYVNGKPTGRWNFVNNIKIAKGEYIALLDGDDYWTDQNKLKMQVDFLEKNPEFAICFHNVNVIYDNIYNKSHPFHTDSAIGLFMMKKPKTVSTLDDLITGNYIQTPSVVFRSRLFHEFPDWFFRQDRGDWPLHILNSQHGKIYYLDKILADYRVHGSGIYSSLKYVDKLEGTINAAIAIDRYFSYRYHAAISRMNTKRFYFIIRNHLSNGELSKSYESFLRLMKCYRFKGLYMLMKILLNRGLSTRKR